MLKGVVHQAAVFSRLGRVETHAARSGRRTAGLGIVDVELTGGIGAQRLKQIHHHGVVTLAHRRQKLRLDTRHSLHGELLGARSAALSHRQPMI